jgi:hypothetical protein
MAKEGLEEEFIPYTIRYKKEKLAKPSLGKVADDVRFAHFRSPQGITDSNLVNQLQEIWAKEKYLFLAACREDVDLTDPQALAVTRVLAKAMVGTGEKPLKISDPLLLEEHPELILIAATYINSL